MNKLEHIKRGLNKKCPCCGLTPIFKTYIKTFNKCKICGIKLSDYKSDDGPAYITIFLIGHLLIPLILLTEKYFSPSLFLQMLIWPLITVVSSLWLLPRVKGAFIGVQIFLNDKSRKTWQFYFNLYKVQYGQIKYNTGKNGEYSKYGILLRQI